MNEVFYILKDKLMTFFKDSLKFKVKLLALSNNLLSTTSHFLDVKIKPLIDKKYSITIVRNSWWNFVQP